MERCLAIIMVADLVGYTRLMSEDEDSALSAIRALREDYLEPRVAAHQGEVLKRMGDGWILAFADSRTGIACALETQKALVDNPEIKLRIGAHIGEIIADEADIYGAGINLAERLQNEAPPGGVMISEDLYRQLSGAQASAFDDAGTFRLKNIPHPVVAWQWRTLGETMTSREVPTILIEPFESAPDNTETQATVADIRDELILRLSHRTGVRVVEGQAASVRRATYTLRGRLRMFGDKGQLRLMLSVIEDGRALFAQTYKGDAHDIFAFSEDIAGRADADLRVQINAFDADRLAQISDDRLSISELRARAAKSIYSGTMIGLDRAIELLERALSLDPSDPMSLAMRANTVVLRTSILSEAMPPDRARAFAADLDTAIEAMPNSDFIFYARAALHALIFRDPDAALRDGQRALELNPSYALGHLAIGWSHCLAGRFNEAVETFRTLVRLSEADPYLQMRLFSLAIVETCAGHHNEALASIDRALLISPKQATYHRIRSHILQRLGKEKAAKCAEKTAANLPDSPSFISRPPPLPEEQTKALLSKKTNNSHGSSGRR